MKAKHLLIMLGISIPFFLHAQSSPPWQMFHKDLQHAGYANVIDLQSR